MKRTSDLLSLPLELRREIYRHDFVSIDNPHGNSYRLIAATTHCNIYCLKTCSTQILSVNPQVYLEARDVLYSDTTWHISFNSLNGRPNSDVISDLSLRVFRSRPEFRFIQNVTIGVMILTFTNTTTWTPVDSDRLEVNRKLLDLVCKTLLLAPNLVTLKLLWHDRIEHGIFEKKLDCLQALAKLPETVKCAVFLGSESSTVHFPHRIVKPGYTREHSAQEQAAKVDFNRHLKTIRQQCQARSRREPLDGLGDASSTLIEQVPVQVTQGQEAIATQIIKKIIGPRARELAW